MMLNHPTSENQHMSGAETDTYNCPTCHADILVANQPTHEVTCARLHRDRPEPMIIEEEPQPVVNQPRINRPELAVRQNSSSGNIYPELDGPFRQAPSRRREVREERKVSDNDKRVTCGTCETRVRESDLENHMKYECVSKEKIPCEFCDQSIPMNHYTDHVDNCPVRKEQDEARREREQQRPRSPGRNLSRTNSRSEQRPNSMEVNRQSEDAPEGSSRRGVSQEQKPGGFMNFLYNVGNAAVSSLKNYATQQGNGTDLESREQRQAELQREQRRRQQQQSEASQQSNFFDRILGGNQHQEHQRTNNRNVIPQRPNRQNQRSRDPFMDIFSQIMEQGQQREQARRNTNPFAQQPSRSGQNTIVRTVERGPFGTMLIRTRVVPVEEAQAMHAQNLPPHMRADRGVEEMGPLGMLLSLLNNGQSGMPMAFGGVEDMSAEERSGIDKQTLDDMAIVKFDKEKFKNLDSEAKTCPICLEEFEDGDDLKFLWCLHRFHKKCVDNWLEKHTNCPVCKKDFSEAEQIEQ